MENQYLVLLRGINVGGNNSIKMADLKACFENMGCTNVSTYIQSGNVVMVANEKNKAKLLAKIEKELSDKFNYRSRVVLITYKQLKKTIDEAPLVFGKHGDNYRYDVIFLKEPLVAREAMKHVRLKEGVDTAYAGKYVVYFSRLISRASQSYITKIMSQPVYQNMTIRNWNTTTNLLAIMENKLAEAVTEE